MRERRSTQTTDEALAWFAAFHNEHGRLPRTKEIAELRGPTFRLVARLGGMAGVAERLDGVEAPKQCRYTYEQLIGFTTEWIRSLNQQGPPSEPQATRAFADGSLRVSPAYLQNHLGYWDDVLTATGLFRFRWQASDCVRAAAQARQKYPERSDLVKALDGYTLRGVTPIESDIRRYYPDLRPLSRERIAWGSWLDRTTKHKTEVGRQCVTSLAMMALLASDGSLTGFDSAVNDIHIDGRGPAFSKELFAFVAPPRLSPDRGYIWALDVFEEKFDVLMNEYRAGSFAQFTASTVVRPVFMPENSRDFSVIALTFHRL